MSTPYQLAGLELASAIVLGQDPATTPLEPASSAATPRAALEEVLVEALQRSRCVIGFSGGQDSSGLLALAVQWPATRAWLCRWRHQRLSHRRRLGRV
jgi:hypothetical protein